MSSKVQLSGNEMLNKALVVINMLIVDVRLSPYDELSLVLKVKG